MSKLRNIAIIDDTITQLELERFTVDSLREYCKNNDLVVSGTKEVVIKRILQHLDEKEGGEEKKEKENKNEKKLKDKKDDIDGKENSENNISGLHS